jgi:hypothetical protein
MRGVLKRVVSRKRDKGGKRSECVLACGHVVRRSISNVSEHCYCTECPPTETKAERSARLSRERRERRKNLALNLRRPPG